MSTTKSKCPTLATVAEHVGVSRMTVSNAFNRPDQLSPALRERSCSRRGSSATAAPTPPRGRWRAAVPARSGWSSTTRSPRRSPIPPPPGCCSASPRECESRSLGLTLVPLLAGADDTHVRTALVDGFVLYSVTRNDARLRAVRERHLPYVLVDHEPADGAQRVNIDDRAAARAMAEHLLGLGHRDIALVHGLGAPGADARRGAGGQHLLRRRRAARRLARGRRGSTATATVASGPGHDRETGRVAGHRLLDRADPPTAVLAFSDLLALGVMDAAAERGVDVPGRLSVVGFDDIAEAARGAA